MTSNRRDFVKKAGAVLGFPAIVPATVFGAQAPSNRIQIGQIGLGRIARVHDIPENLRWTDHARIVSVCDLDAVRLEEGKALIEQMYAKRLGAAAAVKVKTCRDYHEMLADKSIDAVCISTPDHWHAQPAMEAALAGKDIYLQKPASLTIVEGRHMAEAVKQSGRIFQQGSQQRSDAHFRLACELVRNGRIGKIKEIYIGLPEDPAGGNPAAMPVPSNLDYDAWLGSTPLAPYTEDRVHPQKPDPRQRYDRPGWLRCEQFGAGMITGWGAHHIDTAHWAMGVEDTGPVEISGTAEFPKSGLWDVHGPYTVRMRYANGAVLYISEKLPNGLRFIGEDGWIWVTRGAYRAGDPPEGKRIAALDASDPRILRAGLKEGEIRLHASPQNNHHLDWIMAVKERKQPVAAVEAGHRACSACLLAHAAMRTGRRLRWDPVKERFLNDDQANQLLSRTQRAPYGTEHVIRKHGLKIAI
jgi:predicted dehydrogenase